MSGAKGAESPTNVTYAPADTSATPLGEVSVTAIKHSSSLMRQPVKLIREAFCLFENYGMITVEDKTVFITNWDKYQNIDALDRIREQNRARKRRQREREVKK